MKNPLANCRIFSAIAAGEVWQLVAAVLRNGPSWETVPPLLLAIAALIGAVRSYLDGAQARRFAEEEHRAKLGCLRFTSPGMERLN